MKNYWLRNKKLRQWEIAMEERFFLMYYLGISANNLTPEERKVLIERYINARRKTP